MDRFNDGQFDDPEDAGGSMIGDDEGGAIIDLRKALVLAEFETAQMDFQSDDGENIYGLSIGGQLYQEDAEFRNMLILLGPHALAKLVWALARLGTIAHDQQFLAALLLWMTDTMASDHDAHEE